MLKCNPASVVAVVFHSLLFMNLNVVFLISIFADVMLPLLLRLQISQFPFSLKCIRTVQCHIVVNVS